MRRRFRFTASCALLALAVWAGPLALPASSMSGSSLGLPGADQREVEASLGDSALGGGLLGALFLGVPYQGLNGADFAAMALIGLLVYRRLSARPKKDERRFTLHSRDEASQRPVPPGADVPAREGRDAADAGGEASGTSGAGQGRDPRDNPWSRRLGASLQSPADSPWLKVRDRAGAQERPSRPGGPAYMQGGPLYGSEGPASGLAASDGPEPGLAASDGLTAGVLIPEDFDAVDFLEGARALYVRLQEAWAAREMSGLQGFMTPDMLALLQKRADRQPLPLGLSITGVEATLTGLTRHDGLEEARVLFEALMAADGQAPAEVREEWLFRRGLASQGMWQLAKISGC